MDHNTDNLIVHKWRIEALSELQQISQRVLNDPELNPEELSALLDSYRFQFAQAYGGNTGRRPARILPPRIG